MEDEEYLRKYKNYNDEHIKKWEDEGDEVEIFNGSLDEYIDECISDNIEKDFESHFDLRNYINRDKIKYDLVNNYGVEVYDTFIVLNGSSF